MDICPYFGKNELVLLVELYNSYGQLKTHTIPTHNNDVMQGVTVTTALLKILYTGSSFYGTIISDKITNNIKKAMQLPFILCCC